MKLATKLNDAGDTYSITIVEKLTGRTTFDFENAYKKDMPMSVKKVVIDLSKTNFIDSTGLGLLLNLREYANLRKLDVELHLGANETMTDFIAMANFQQLFKVVN